MRKKIKTSKRGLTFSLSPKDISVGTKYRYIINKKQKQIIIVPDENGPLKVSKKKSGKNENPLFDLRNKEIKNAISDADFLEVEVQEKQIVVYTYQKSKTKFKVLKNKYCSISEVLGTKTHQFSIPAEMAAGSEIYQYTIDDWLSSITVQKGARTSINTDNTSNISKQLTKVYDIVSLFSGAGLFDKAWLDDGRFRFVYANDFCKEVLDTYRYNIGNHIVCKDIRDVKPSELPFADVFSTSPCCQGYSIANRHNVDTEISEKKRLLIENIPRLVNGVDIPPKIIVVENVPQLMTKNNGLYLDKLLQGLPNYESSVHVVCDYKVGGYTTRERCIVILSSIGKITLPEIEVLPYKTVQDALSKVNSEWYNYNDYTIPKPETIRKMECVPQGGNWRDIPKDVFEYKKHTHSNVMRRLAWNEIAPTIANVRKDNMMPPEGNRCLSIAEAAALMGLHKDFRFIGKLSSMQQMIANGVTQAIGKFVKNTVLKALDAHELSIA